MFRIRFTLQWEDIDQGSRYQSVRLETSRKLGSLSSDQDNGQWSQDQPVGLENSKKVEQVILIDSMERDCDNVKFH